MSGRITGKIPRGVIISSSGVTRPSRDGCRSCAARVTYAEHEAQACSLEKKERRIAAPLTSYSKN